MNQTELTDFGTRYAAAWSSQHPASLASFYNENGSLTVNGSAPSRDPALCVTASFWSACSLREASIACSRRTQLSIAF